MRSLWFGFVLLLLIHLTAAGAGVGWLYATDRINEDRLNRLVDLFTPTIPEEQAALAEAERIAEENRQLAADAARLEAVAQGPVSLSQRLASQQQADELSMHRLERLQSETADLRGQINRLKSLLAREQSKLAAEREAFDRYKNEQRNTTEEADFQQAVAMFEAIQARQAKSVVDQMTRENRLEEAIDILAAMQPRKAGAVLREFKEPADIPQLTDIIRRLRDRGVNDPSLTNANPLAGNNL
ncbi:hypothetical protein [Mucisphaera sp.]|uniref:hypothetical protein n=1 Tax=Mucisphaera sp. TaxID=2913024 RepID=UPI003D130140